MTIIGVIAALTIPNLIAKHDKEQTVTKLKKAYSTIQFAINRAIADNGPVQTWDFSTVDDNNNQALPFTKKYIFPYISLSKICISNTNECSVTNRKYLNGDDYTILDGNNYHRYVSFFLNDGTFITLIPETGDISFVIDINGPRKPNTVGKDIFTFLYGVNAVSGHSKRDQLGPVGFFYPRSTLVSELNGWACKNGKKGVYCGALIIQDGWKISDDYPW